MNGAFLARVFANQKFGRDYLRFLGTGALSRPFRGVDSRGQLKEGGLPLRAGQQRS